LLELKVSEIKLGEKNETHFVANEIFPKGWQPNRNLSADCLENVSASKTPDPIVLHGLLQG
jgi:hypothetical protein